MNVKPGLNPPSRSITLLATLMTPVVLAPACAAAAQKLGPIVLKIGTDIIVSEGEKYLKHLLSLDRANGDPTLIVSHTDAAGDGVGADFAVDGATAFSVKSLKGDIHLVGDGNGLAVTNGQDRAGGHCWSRLRAEPSPRTLRTRR